MTEKITFKGRAIPCPNCKSQLRASWLNGMSAHSGFMYSDDGNAILILSEAETEHSAPTGFNYQNSLRCPVCLLEIAKRSEDPSRDKSIFLEGMRYLTGDHEFVVTVQIP